MVLLFFCFANPYLSLLFPLPLSTLAAILKSGVLPGEQAGIGSMPQPLGMVDTMRSIMRDEGPRGLYRGLLPNFLKVIPAVSIGYVVYEQLKLLLGVDTVR